MSVVENELEAELLNQSFNKTKFQKEEVDLLLPSFKIEADLQLKEILQSVGRIHHSVGMIHQSVGRILQSIGRILDPECR